jgi:IMP dehydrogenase/GMP reductase
MVDWKKLTRGIPHRVQVARNAFYEVLYVDAFVQEDVLGETRFDRKQIVIKDKQHPKEKVHTYIHELLHAISEEYEVNLTEAQVRALEKALYYVMKSDNVFRKAKK